MIRIELTIQGVSLDVILKDVWKPTNMGAAALTGWMGAHRLVSDTFVLEQMTGTCCSPLLVRSFSASAQ